MLTAFRSAVHNDGRMQNGEISKCASPARSFATRFCSRYGYPLQAFPSEALLRVIDYRGLALARVLWRIRPAFFRTELEILTLLGAARVRSAATLSDSRIEREYRSRNQFGLIREYLHVRISEDRLLILVCRVWPAKEHRLECKTIGKPSQASIVNVRVRPSGFRTQIGPSSF